MLQAFIASITWIFSILSLSSARCKVSSLKEKKRQSYFIWYIIMFILFDVSCIRYQKNLFYKNTMLSSSAYKSCHNERCYQNFDKTNRNFRVTKMLSKFVFFVHRWRAKYLYYHIADKISFFNTFIR